jgi:hypothetical protein
VAASVGTRFGRRAPASLGGLVTRRTYEELRRPPAACRAPPSSHAPGRAPSRTGPAPFRGREPSQPPGSVPECPSAGAIWQKPHFSDPGKRPLNFLSFSAGST